MRQNIKNFNDKKERVFLTHPIIDFSGKTLILWDWNAKRMKQGEMGRFKLAHSGYYNTAQPTVFRTYLTSIFNDGAFAVMKDAFTNAGKFILRFVKEFFFINFFYKFNA